MNHTRSVMLAAGACLWLAACGEPMTADPGTCTLAEHTMQTSSVNSSGCSVLSRDTSPCEAERKAQGLSGYWLKFSCRVSLSSATEGGASVVRAQADGQPDYKSFYFSAGNTCYEPYSGATRNPNSIRAQSYSLSFPVAPSTSSQPMGPGVVGLALNGVPIFANLAAPGDDIYAEASTFDQCGAHPERTGRYHYHSEPYAISYDDSHFIGVMRDGYPIYGRKDADGSHPTLDSYGGHTSPTPDSPTQAVYHYHLNEQTSTASGTFGLKQWFLTTGTFRGTPAACSGCN